jgi:hypothetical protein
MSVCHVTTLHSLQSSQTIAPSRSLVSFCFTWLKATKNHTNPKFYQPNISSTFQALEALGLPAEFHVQSTGSILSAFLGYQPIRVGEDSFFILFHRFFSMKTYWGWQGQLSHNSRLPSTSLLELHDCRATDHKNSLGVSESGLYHQNCNANPFPPNTKRPPLPPMNKHLR